MTTAQSSDDFGELYCATCERQFFDGPLCPHDGTTLVRLTAAADPLLGRELDGRFTIVEKLGQGGMGAVYRARQHSMGREIAVKVLSAALVSDATSIKRFLREAKLASRLAHPNVVSVLDFGQTQDGVFYLVMELVEGQTLAEVLKREGPLSLSRMLRIATQICDALDGAHALSIVHRDLKPANVMVLAHGRDLVKVLDFGLAKSLSTDNTGGTVTSAGALLGTPAFMPPEVAKGHPADRRADLYSLGCIIYAMGTGRPPFVTDSVLEMIALHGSQTAPPMTRVPEEIAAVVNRLLQKDPDRRYQTATAVRSALEDAYERTRASRPAIEAPSSRHPAVAAPVPAPPSAKRPAITGRGSATPARDDDNADTMPVPRGPPNPRALPGEPTNRRSWRRPAWLVVIMFGVTIASAAVLDRLALLPDPDRPAGEPSVKPPPQAQPTPSTTQAQPTPTTTQAQPTPTPPQGQPTPSTTQAQPAPPTTHSEPPPLAADHAITPPSEPAGKPTVPDPVVKRRVERPTKRVPGRKKPAAASKTVAVPAPTKPPIPRPSPPTRDPTNAGAGSSVRPGAGSSAPF